MLRELVDQIFNKHPILRDVCLRWLPFASESFNRDAWIAYLNNNPTCVLDIVQMADGEGQKYIRRLVARKRRVRFICTLDEAVRYCLVMRTRIAYRFPQEGTMLRSVFTYKAGCSFLPNMPDLTNRVVIDGGAASGDSSVVLAELKPQKVLAFEPSPRQRSEINEVLRQNGFIDDIEVMPYALSDRKKLVRIADQHGEVYDVNAVAIDEIAKNLDVGLIKLDIEGAEFPTLKGGVETIRRCHPILLICVYHNPEDLFEMPKWLIGQFPEYRFVFRDTEPGNKGAGVHLMMIAWSLQ